MVIRRKGVALVENDNGILVVSGRNKIFSLPGGGANSGESRKHAAMRELTEETGLKPIKSKFLASYRGNVWHTKSGRAVRNYAKVFIIRAFGKARPRHEIKHIAYWKPESKIKISGRTKWVIDKYFEEMKK